MSLHEQLAEFEEALVEQTEAARLERVQVQRKVAARADERRRAKTHRRGSFRFLLLCLVLIATAVAVTIAMFETLYLVMG